MQNGAMNVVLDAFWGSSGKGKVCDWLTAVHGVKDLVSGNMPNAGHTVVRNGESRVLKVLPSGAPFNRDARIWLSGSTGFKPARLEEELSWFKDRPDIKVSDRAFTVNEEHAETERNGLNHIASTMQGSGAALSEKIMRKDYSTLRDLGQSLFEGEILHAFDWRTRLIESILGRESPALYEVAQGWGLSIDHGTHYPQCTSRNCSVQRALDDCAIPPQMVGDVIAVIRPYPIRVGNTEGGHSGGWTPDCTEVSWDHVAKTSGLTEDLTAKEKTTVTKRVRRVSTFSFELLQDCVIHNGVSGIFLNFAQYIDASIAGMRGDSYVRLPKSVRIFVDAIESATNTPVIGLGTGADTFDVVTP